MAKGAGMDIYTFKRMLMEKHPNSHYFDIGWLKFFGIRLSETKVLEKYAFITDWKNERHKCYVLSSYQWNAPEGVSKRHHDYFDSTTLERVFPKGE